MRTFIIVTVCITTFLFAGAALPLATRVDRLEKQVSSLTSEVEKWKQLQESQVNDLIVHLEKRVNYLQMEIRRLEQHDVITKLQRARLQRKEAQERWEWKQRKLRGEYWLRNLWWNN